MRAWKLSNSPLMLVKKSEISASAETPVACSRRRSRKPAAAVHRPQRRPAGGEVRPHEPPDDALVEEVAEALRRLEEVERVARRRRVDDDQVVVAALGEHAELLDRHVLLRAGEGLREVLVEGVRRGCAARASGGAWRSTSASQAPFWSSIIADSVPRGRQPLGREQRRAGSRAARCRASRARARSRAAARDRS